MTYLSASAFYSRIRRRPVFALLQRPGILPIYGALPACSQRYRLPFAGFRSLPTFPAVRCPPSGLADLGVITVDDVAWFVRQVAALSGLPVLVDGDTGYGGPAT